jgi:hypothetical protein
MQPALLAALPPAPFVLYARTSHFDPPSLPWPSVADSTLPERGE